MPRPKKYNRSEAVEKACNSFWQHGYSSLGVRALEQQTGLNRFAIQTEFGGKEGLFLEALAVYSRETEEQYLRSLREGNLDHIETLFSQLATPSGNGCRIYGCLMVNTIVENTELASSRIKERTDQHFERFKTAFNTALLNAQSHGQLSKSFNLEEGVAFLRSEERRVGKEC